MPGIDELLNRTEGRTFDFKPFVAADMAGDVFMLGVADKRADDVDGWLNRPERRFRDRIRTGGAVRATHPAERDALCCQVDHVRQSCHACAL